MPANIVKPGEEHLWEKAKRLAKQKGHEEDWAYVVRIFQRMTGKLSKGLYIPYPFRECRTPGQVPAPRPNRNELRVQKDLMQLPNDVTVARLLDDNAPRPTARSVVDNLGLEATVQKSWADYLEKAVRAATNELTFRQGLQAKLHEAPMESELRMAIMQRALNHWRTLRKGLVEVVTADDVLEKAWGAERPGHKYLRRKRVGDHWEYEYPGEQGNEKKIHVQDATGHKPAHPEPKAEEKPAPERPKLVMTPPKPKSGEQLGLFSARVANKPKAAPAEPAKPEPTRAEPVKPKEEFVADPRGIPAALNQAQKDTDAHELSYAARMDALPDGTVISRSGGQKFTKETIDGDVFWKWEGRGGKAKGAHTSRQAFLELGAKAVDAALAAHQTPKPPAPEKPKLVLTQPEAKGKEGLTAEIGEHVWGSRKDKMALRSAEDIEALNPDEQAKVVTKKRLMPTWEPEDLLEQGWSPDGVLLRKAFESLIAEKPENSLESRKGFFEACDFVTSSMAQCRTAQDVMDFLEDWGQLIEKHRKIGTASPEQYLQWVDEYLTAQGTPPKMPWKERKAWGDRIEQFEKLARWGYLRSPKGMEDPAVKNAHEALAKVKAEAEAVGAIIPYVEMVDVVGHHFQKPFLRLNVGSDGRIQAYEKDESLGHKLDNAYTRMALACGKRMIDAIAGGGGPYGHKRPKVLKDALEHARQLRDIGDEEKRAEALFTLLGQKRAGGQKRPPFKWERAVPGEIDRKGGREVSKADPQALAKDFGFKNVQFGEWVTEGDADSHLKGAHGALFDLADLLGVDPKHISLNGRLSIAFGARGSGKAAAHYEPSQRIINITKIAGGGTLAHEYGHALDHLIAEAADPTSTKAGRMLSHGDHAGVSPRVAEAMRKVMQTLQSKNPEAYAAREKADQMQRDARSGNVRVTREMRAEFSRLSALADKDKPSDYLKHAMSFSQSPDSYWTRPHELFARAFEAYIEDTLQAQGRKSSYLVAGTQEQYITGKHASAEDHKAGRHAQPYPQGEERKAINRAMGELVKVLAEEKALEKALKALDWKQGRYFFHAPSADADEAKKTREARGGNYHRRVPKPGGGFKYYYDPEKYAAEEKDAHLSGEEAKAGYLHKRVHQAVDEQGKRGAHPKHFAHLVQKHGAQPVADTLRQSIKGGKLEYRNGRFFGVVDPEEAQDGNQAGNSRRGAGQEIPGKVHAGKGGKRASDRAARPRPAPPSA